MKFPLIKFKTPQTNLFDLITFVFLFIFGFIYLHDFKFWGVGYIGDTQYGDAQFWWDGALHLAQGIFQDNPGKGFRPGYFILTGLTLPILGEQFQQFYPYFLFVFLSVCYFLYYSLISGVGRWVSACLICLIVFNPFTAEWLATSTTDGTGLLLNLAALSCLFLGIKRKLNLWFLFGFGVFFALANLTRPLMSSFIALMILTLLFFVKTSFQRRMLAILVIVAAFFLPTATWMGVQKLVIDQWSVSTNDASAFYAASDPSIQVWNGAMYDEIKKEAINRYNTKEPNDRMMNKIFWQKTVQNYFKYPSYHLNRMWPHIWELAKFSPKRATHGSDYWRLVILISLAGGLALWFLSQRRWYRSLFMGISILFVYYYPILISVLTLLGVISALFIQRGDERKLIFFILATYWVTGIFSLYLVGGTWGPPIGSAFDLNALGYRLGSQFFFAGDLLAVYFLIWVAYTRLDLPSLKFPKFMEMFNRPSYASSVIVYGFISFFIISLSLTYLLGTIVIFKRVYAQSHFTHQSFPSIEPILRESEKKYSTQIVKVKGFKGSLESKDLFLMKNNNILVFTGIVSPFIWGLEGQKRTQLMIHTQNFLRPNTLGPNWMIVEVPERISIQDWSGKQGVFLIQEVTNLHNESNLPYYLTVPTIRAFVPLEKNKNSFDLSHAIWFPLVKYATQLETNKQLQFPNTKVTWMQNSGTENYKRRFFINPDNKEQKAKLVLKIHTNNQPSILTFEYVWGDINNIINDPKGDYELNIYAISKTGATQILTKKEDYDQKNLALNEVKVSIPKKTDRVELTFSKIYPKSGIWIYEFNLSEPDNTHYGT